MKNKLRFSVLVSMVVLVALTGSLLFTIPACNQNTEQKQDSVQVIKIGAILPLTGDYSINGKYVLNGIETAIEEINENGGIKGKKVLLFVEDSKGNAKDGINSLNKMVLQNNVFAIISAQSNVTMALKPITEEKKILLVGLIGATNFLENSKYCIRNYLDPVYLGENVSIVLKDSLHANNIGVFYANTEYSISVYNGFLKKAADKNLQVIYNQIYEDNLDDKKNIIAKVVNKKVDYIYVTGNGSSLGNIIKEIKTLKKEVHIISDVTLPIPNVVNAAGNAINGVKYLDFELLNNDAAKLFADKFRQKHSYSPNAINALSYTFCILLCNVIEKSNSNTVEEIVKMINNVRNFPSVLGNVDVNNSNIEYELCLKEYQIVNQK